MFIPGSSQPRDLDAAMRTALADSLDYIFSTAADHLGIAASQRHAAVEAIRSHRVAPGVFGRYYKLVMALQAGEMGAARSLSLQIVDAAAETPAFGVTVYSERALGDTMRLYGDLIDPDAGTTPWLCSPATPAGFEQRVNHSLELIATADPLLADELRALVIQVAGAAPYDGPGAVSFGSVSSFMLWGLLILNVERYRTAADLIQGLVHEAAHLLLFAHSIDGPLVTNPIEERYVSPLRPDPRPMDGVFHATFVSARLHYVNAKLREASNAAFEPVPIEELDQRLADLRRLYFGGAQTVRDHAKLTKTGQRILEESLDYMTSV